MAYCGKCLHLDVCKTADSCDGHVPRCKHFMDKTEISQTLGKPATRADQLRAMPDEELAAALYDNANCVWCGNLSECAEMMDANNPIEDAKCLACLLAWLQQPVEDTP